MPFVKRQVRVRTGGESRRGSSRTEHRSGAAILFALVFIGIAVLVIIILVVKNGRRSAPPHELGSAHAEWTFPRDGAPAEQPVPQQDPAGPAHPQDPAGPTGPTGTPPAA